MALHFIFLFSPAGFAARIQLKNCHFSRANIQDFDRQSQCLGLLWVAAHSKHHKTYLAEQRELDPKIVPFFWPGKLFFPSVLCLSLFVLQEKGGMRLACYCSEQGQLLPVQTVFLSLSLAASVVLPVSGSPSSSVNLSPPPHFQETNKLNIQVPVGSYESTSSHNSEQSFSLYL